jgi:hypothetical protein
LTSESFLGAVASSTGDDFHERWAARALLRLLDPASHVVAIKVEGLPADDFHHGLGEHSQAVDVALTLEKEGKHSYQYLQLKYSPSRPAEPWDWSRLYKSSSKTDSMKSVLGKLAGLMEAIFFEGRFSIVTNQPLADKVAADVARLIANDGAQKAADKALISRLTKKLGLDEVGVIKFLRSWDLDGFNSVTRLQMETEVIRRLAAMTDADARTDADLLQQRVSELVLPESRALPPLTRQTLMVWLGIGTDEALFPAPSRLSPAQPYIRRPVVDPLLAWLGAPMARPLRLHAAGGCGKTSLVCGLPDELPPGSELVIYDCYGGGLFLTSDQKRHLPERAFGQVANELAVRLKTPFLLRRGASASPFDAFRRRVAAAAELIAERGPDALLVLCFDAVDNARTGATRWVEPCFIDELASASGWPTNVRILMTCRTARRLEVGPTAIYDEFEVPAFDEAETRDLVASWQPAWSPALADQMREFTGGNPRRMIYAMEGLGPDESEAAIARLLPKGEGIDPLFEKRVAEAGFRLGDSEAVWRLLGAFARLPRPVPADILERLLGLSAADLVDIAADVGGIVEHEKGWTFHDEDFEHFAAVRTEALAEGLIDQAAELLIAEQMTSHYAATSLAEILVEARRLDALYALVAEGGDDPPVLSRLEAQFVRARRLALAIRCARQASDLVTVSRLLVAAAEGRQRQEVLEKLIVGHLDLAALYAPDEAIRLVMVGQDHAKKRARLRISLARASAPNHRPAAQLHYHWWRQYLADLKYEDERRPDVDFRDLAAEHDVVAALSGEVDALNHLFRWRPKTIVAKALALIAIQHGGRSPAPALELIAMRTWSPAALAPMMAVALLAGATFAEPVLKDALARLASASAARWRKAASISHERREFLDVQEAALFVCEWGIADPALRPLVARILSRLAPRPVPKDVTDLFRLRSSAAFHARALALAELCSGAPTILKDWLPPLRQEPPVKPNQRAPRGQRRTSDEKAWNDALSETQSLLNRFLEAARATLRLVTGAVPAADAVDALAKALNLTFAYERVPREANGATSLLRAGTLHATLAGLSPPVERVRRTLRSWHADSITAMTDLSQALALIPAGHDAALGLLAALADEIEQDAGGASQKSEQLCKLARAALPLDEPLARTLFDRAVQVTAIVDYDALGALSACGEIAKAGLGGDREVRRALAERLAEAADRVVQTLSLGMDYDWPEALAWVAAIDLPAGLAVAARWQDRGIAGFELTLPELLKEPPLQRLTGIQRYALSLLAGAERPNLSDLYGADEAVPSLVIADELRRRLNGGDKNGLPSAIDAIQERGGKGPALDEGRATAALFDSWSEAEAPTPEEVFARPAPLSPRPDEAPIADREALHAAVAQCRPSYDPNILCLRHEAVAARLASRALRVPFLAAAKRLDGERGTLGQALPKILADWDEYPPVCDWLRDELPDYLATALPHLFHWNYDDNGLFASLLEATRLPPEEQAGIVVEGLERHAERAGANLIFALVGVVAARAPVEARNDILLGLLRRLGERADQPPRLAMIGVDTPADEAECVGRLLFAAMGDMEVAVRWRAAHAGLLLLRAGDPAGEALARQIASPGEAVFATAPFYLYAALEMLLVTLRRAAAEVPKAVASHAPALLARLRAEPHVTIRELGRETLLGLEANGVLALDAADKAFVAALNRSPHRPVKVARRSHPRARFHDERKERAFRFDTTDTIPYWYDTPAELFGLSMEDFLDRVEAWVHGRWGFVETDSHWAEEPRLERLRQNERGMSHRHGSRPPVERLSRYVEWHGMCCAVGELIEAMPIVTRNHGNTLAEWLKRSLPTLDPYWLADLRRPAPLEPRFWGHGVPQALVEADADVEDGWQSYEDEDDPDQQRPSAWGESITPVVFDAELKAADGRLIVSADFRLERDRRSHSVWVSSALVSPETAASLGQALLTVRNPMDFCFPRDEDDEIDKPGFVWKRWLSDLYPDAGADRDDERRGTVSGVPVAPLMLWPETKTLTFDLGRSAWIDGNGGEAMRLTCWGEEQAGNGSGWRLGADPAFIARLLRRTGLSMIFLVEVARRISGREMADPRRWALYVLDSGGTISRIERRRRGLGPVLIRREKMVQSCNTHGRWLLHRAAELVALRDEAPDAERAAYEAEIERICARFRTLKRY